MSARTALAIARRGLLIHWRDYVWTVVVVVAATAIRHALSPVLGEGGFAISLAALLAICWVGGLGPGIVAQVLTLVLSFVFFPGPANAPPKPLPELLAGLGAFVGVGLIVSLLSDRSRRAQRRAEAQAREATSQRDQLRTTLACIGDGVIVTDIDGRVTMMNPIAELFTGWSAGEACGASLESVVYIEDEAPAQSRHSLLERVQKRGVSRADTPLVLVDRDKRRTPIDYSVAQVRDEAGQATGVVLVLRDESPRRQTEQLLRDADRRKDEFLATLAHELRNPLAPIRTGLEVLKASHDRPEVTAQVRPLMERQVHQLVRLIDDLLDVSRITQGKLRLRLGEVELADVIRDAVDAVHPAIVDARHDLTIELPDQPTWLHADSSRLAQVFSNLLRNAAKYTPAGGRIRIDGKLGEGQVAVTVADSGLGIPPDMLEQIFEMFAQIDAPSDAARAGLGIGLTLVKSLVEMHGGHIAARSDGAGRGSAFEVILPVQRCGQAVARPASPDDANKVVQPKRRVLVVDDNQDAAHTLSQLVGMLGHDVCVAADGAEALEQAAAFRPDVVLMDLGMPRVDGFEAARRIRQQPWGERMILVATTGWGQEDDKRRSKAVGFDHHLVKPVEMRTLQIVLADQRRVSARPTSTTI